MSCLSSKCSDRRPAARPICLPIRTNNALSLLFTNAVVLSVMFNWCLLAVATTSNDKTAPEQRESDGLKIEIVIKPSECETKK